MWNKQKNWPAISGWAHSKPQHEYNRVMIYYHFHPNNVRTIRFSQRVKPKKKEFPYHSLNILKFTQRIIGLHHHITIMCFHLKPENNNQKKIIFRIRGNFVIVSFLYFFPIFTNNKKKCKWKKIHNLYHKKIIYIFHGFFRWGFSCFIINFHIFFLSRCVLLVWPADDGIKVGWIMNIDINIGS